MHFIHPPILQRIIDSMGRFTWMQGCLKLLLPPTAWGPYRSAHEEGWPRPTSCRTALEMKLPFGNTSPPNYTLQKVTVHGTYQVINEAENIDHFFEILGTSMHLHIKFRDSKRTCLHCLPNPRTAQVPCTSFPERRTMKLLNTKTCGCPWNDRNTHAVESHSHTSVDWHFQHLHNLI